MNEFILKADHQYVGLPQGEFFQTGRIFIHGKFTVKELETWVSILKEYMKDD